MNVSRFLDRLLGRLGDAALVVCTILAAAAAAYYVYVIAPFVGVPADILMFAESDFVGNIIKLRNGQPLYTPPADNNSLVYTPLAPVLTYAIAAAAGAPTSIPAFRAIQVGYAALAALVTLLCCLRLVRMCWPDARIPHRRTWTVAAFLFLFLAATAPRVSPFAHALHADALALLITACTFWSLLRYLDAPTWRRLIVLAAWPTIGFLTKQFLFIWAPLIAITLIVAEPRAWRRAVAFGAIVAAFYLAAVGVCYWLWGDAFMFWVFEVIGGERRRIGFSPDGFNISLVRSVNHLLIAWPEIAVGVFGLLALLRSEPSRRMAALTTSWALLVLAEALTSGTAWQVLYHFGPGVLLGTMFLLAAAAGHLAHQRSPGPAVGPLAAARESAWLVAGAMTVLFALHVFPTGRPGARSVPPRGPSADLARYVAEIEREFEGLAIDDVLLDVGNWIYLRHSHLAKDRAIPLGDQPPVGIYENIEAFVRRIEDRRYAKILVRNFRSDSFLYDWHNWPRPSGVRAALLKQYREVRVIPAAAGTPISELFTGPISVFERPAAQ